MTPAVLVRGPPDGEARHDEDHGDRRQPREEDDQEGMSPKRAHAPNRLPLPFISFGGSALLMTMVSTGVLLNISQHSHA